MCWCYTLIQIQNKLSWTPETQPTLKHIVSNYMDEAGRPYHSYSLFCALERMCQAE